MIGRFSRRGNSDDYVLAVKLSDLNVATTTAWCKGRTITERDAISHSMVMAVQFLSFGKVVRAYLGDYVVWDPRQGFLKKKQDEFESEFVNVEETAVTETKAEIKTDDPFEGMTRFSDD